MISHQELTWYAMHDVSLGKIQLLLFKLSPCLQVCTYRVFGFCWAENLNTDQQSVNWTSNIISIGSHGYDYWKSSGSCVILNHYWWGCNRTRMLQSVPHSFHIHVSHLGILSVSKFFIDFTQFQVSSSEK